MKKGFILALLMVAMVAMALPVSARAPIVGPLPTIIIGDADDAVTTGILRAPDILDLMDEGNVDWNNPTDVYTSDLYHVYLLNLEDPADPNILPYDATGIIDLLTTTEYAGIIDDGTQPAASARIPMPALSLFDATHHPAITDPAGADPATEGEVLSTYTAETTLVLIAAVEAIDSGTLAATDDEDDESLADSVSPLKVRCQSSGTDDREPTSVPVASYTFENSAENWIYATVGGITASTSLGGTSGTTGIGFRITGSAAEFMHGFWKSPQTIACSSAQAGQIYMAVAELSSTATSSDLCSGWRLTFRQAGFTHFGKITVETTGTQPTGEENTPKAGSNYEAKLFWVAPYFLGDMGEAEGQASAETGDLRLYLVSFDSMARPGDTGDLLMEGIDISYILRPLDRTPVIAWGDDEGATAFNAAAGTGGWRNAGDHTGFTPGPRTISAANCVISVGSGEKTYRYSGVTSQDFQPDVPYTPMNQLLAQSNRLYRFSASIACSSRAAVPEYRIILNGWNRFPDESYALRGRKMIWAEFYAQSNLSTIGKLTDWIRTNQSASVCPGAPGVTTPTRFEVCIWSHNVVQSASVVSTIYPLIDVVDIGIFGTGTLWADPTANMTLTDAQWEDLGPDY